MKNGFYLTDVSQLFLLLYDPGKHNRNSYRMKTANSSVIIFKDENAKKVFS